MNIIRFSRLVVIWLVLGGATVAPAGQENELHPIDRIRLAEARRLEAACNKSIWSNWDSAPSAILLVTDSTEFLIDHPNPSADFQDAGWDEALGTDVYTRARTFSPNLLATFPAVSGIPTTVIGQVENTHAGSSTPWVLILLHEHFHQLQMSDTTYFAATNALDLSGGDQSGMWMLNYPFPYDSVLVADAYADLAASLLTAVKSIRTDSASATLNSYRSRRDAFANLLSPADYRYFSFQLWQEGIARYTEYEVARWAAAHYTPSKEFRGLSDFKPFGDSAEKLYAKACSDLESASLASRQRVAFYSFGLLEGLLLDSVNPDWKAQYFTDKFHLEHYYPETE